jgi:signal transduction histidine kinase/ActR/RegA family two-component response regulator
VHDVVAAEGVKMAGLTTYRGTDLVDGERSADHRSISSPAAIDTRSLQILADTGSLLATTLDLGQTVRRVGELMVPAMADLCLVHLYTPGDDGGEIKRVLQVMHPYPGTTDWTPAIKINRLNSDNPIAIAVGTRKPVRIIEVNKRDLVEIAADEANLPEIRSIRPRTLLCLPLLGRERVLGTLTLVSAGGAARDLGNANAGLAEVVAQRVAWALDSALTHEASERARRGSDEARVALEAANQMRDTFLASLSHELRTPMAALLLWVDILRTAKESSMRARALNAIHVSAMSQSKLIEDLLDISRCLSGKLLMENRVVSVGSLIDSALEAALPSARAKSVRLESEYHPALGCVLGDSARLRQVLGNLLSNAIKFTDRGGLVTVRAVGVGTRVEISVVDSGCGIAPDFLPQVFLPFRQGGGQLPRTQVGLGLGLAIVRQLVEMHDGTVRAESAGLGHGSSFIIALPLVAARSVVDVSRPETPSRRSLPRYARSVRGLRILIVDDEPAVLEALALILRGEGCEVVKCRSVPRALAALRRGRWDAVVSDIAMPGDDGYSFMRRLRDQDPLGRRHIPAIALTAHARPQDELRAIEAGFDVHIPKPVEAEDLVGAIADIVERQVERQTVGMPGGGGSARIANHGGATPPPVRHGVTPPPVRHGATPPPVRQEKHRRR